MAGYGEPEWVNPSNTTNTPVVSDANLDPGVTTIGAAGTNGQGFSSGSGGCLLCCLSILNMGLATLMTALGVLTIISVHNQGLKTLSEPFLAFYMILFAVLLFLYELMWWSTINAVNENMRKNFGFMYGLRGKGLYLIFVGFLCFGLGKDASWAWLNYLTGASFLAGGILHLVIIFSKPEIAREYQPAGRKKELAEIAQRAAADAADTAV